jgi:hypothetical protein
MTCSQIAAQLEHGFDFLATSVRNAPDRHRSIRAVFDHSWKLLAPDEQAIFRKLVVFRGGFEREAAEQVANASFRILAALIDKSLLRMSAVGRYDLHELVRQYAEQQLEASGEHIAVLTAHSAYYMDFLVQRDDDVKGRRQMAALHEIRRDFDNIRAAWQWASEHRQYEAISQAVNCLLNFAEMGGPSADILGLLYETTAVFTATANEMPYPVWEKILVRRDWLAMRMMGEIDPIPIQDILGRARQRKDREEIAWCLWLLSDLTRSVDSAKLLALSEELLALWRILGDEFYIAHALFGFGDTYNGFGQLERAINSVIESAAIRRQLGDKNGLFNSLIVTGLILINHIQFSEAKHFMEEAIALRDEIGSTPLYGVIPFAYAFLAFWRADFETAAQSVQEGLETAQDRNYIGLRSVTLAVLSYVLSMRGDYGQAREICEPLRATVRDPSFALFINWGLALACCGSGDDRIANQALQNVLQDELHFYDSPLFQLLCLPLMSILSARNGDSHRAVELLGLFSTAPRELTGWADKWPLLARLRENLEAELGEKSYATAWAKGRAMSLEQVDADALEK